MGLIFARTNFRELENFAFREDLFSRMSCFTIFREDLLLRIGYAENFRKYVNTKFHESAILRYFASTYICESIVFSFSWILIFANRTSSNFS